MALPNQPETPRRPVAGSKNRGGATGTDILGSVAFAVSLITPLLFFATYSLAFLGVLQRLPHFDRAALFKTLTGSSPLAVAIGAAACFRQRSRNGRYALVLGALGCVIWIAAMVLI